MFLENQKGDMGQIHPNPKNSQVAGFIYWKYKGL